MDLWRYLENGGRRAAAVWHRRAGKDEVCLHWAAVSMVQKPATYWHMLPEASQARKAIWEAVNPHTGRRRIDEAFPEAIRATTREQEMLIRLKNGATWQVVGSDNFDSLVGSPPYGVVFSEWSLANPDAWAYLRPILAENGGWALFIYTPRGDNHGKSTIDHATQSPEWFGQILDVDKTGVFTPSQLEAEKQEMVNQYGRSRGEALFNQEYYCSFAGAFEGKVVYPDFDYNFHVAKEPLLPLVQEGIRMGKKVVVRGWDNTGLHPAAVVSYLHPSGQWMIFKEFWIDDCDIVEFGNIVKAWCGENLPGATYQDIGDPAGTSRDSRKRSPRDYLAQECGIYISEGIQTFAVRKSSVAVRLSKQVNGGPALVVDPIGCPVAVQGFNGGYRYKEIGNTGLYTPDPVKDKHADVHDAIQYPATVLFGPTINDEPGAVYPDLD